MSNTQTEAWTIQRLLDWTTDFFKKKERDSPRLAAEILLAAALECQRIDLYTRFAEVPSESVLASYRDWVKRHGAGEPVAYLVGHKEFLFACLSCQLSRFDSTTGNGASGDDRY